jgi:REP element-mobilizing transposase RayT
MANTYSQLNTHVVFAVKGRENILPSKMRPELFKYISGILTNTNQFSLAVNGYKDHVHMFFEMSPAKSLSDIVRIVKANSSKCPPDPVGQGLTKINLLQENFHGRKPACRQAGIWWFFIFPFTA